MPRKPSIDPEAIGGLLVDGLILLGLGMIFYGLYQVLPWLAYTATGALLVALGLRFLR